jgi:DnaK suppressor protein
MIFNMKLDLKHFKQKLEEEKVKLESELKTVGRINPSNPNDWQAVPSDMEADAADRLEVAESIDQFEENTAILKELEIQLNDVKHALKKIDDNTYGLCEEDKKPIPVNRLEANPAAKTCIEHAKHTKIDIS